MKKIFQMKEQSQKEAGVKDGKELHIRKNDWILIVILLVAAAGEKAWGTIWLIPRTHMASVIHFIALSPSDQP